MVGYNDGFIKLTDSSLLLMKDSQTYKPRITWAADGVTRKEKINKLNIEFPPIERGLCYVMHF